MARKIYKTPQEVYERGCEAIGIPFGEIDKTGRLQGNKGGPGQMMEENWFDLPPNNRPEPDFVEAGVELKVTPFKITRNGVSAKERLVCNIIDFMEEYKRDFATSSVYTKCNTMLIMIYEHVVGMDKRDYCVSRVELFRFPEEDLRIIERDWGIIVDKIKAGKAHEISESDTMYLGACTKGSPKKGSGELVLVEQPFSPEPARKRAFCLKQSYMTYLMRTRFFGAPEEETAVKDGAALATMDFGTYIRGVLAPYVGQSQAALKQQFGIHSDAKSLNRMIVSAIFGVHNIEETAEFQKAGIKIKTIRLEADGKSIEQSMSFPEFSFLELAQQEWEDSPEYKLLVQQKYLFVIFQKDDVCNRERNNPAHTQRHLFLKTAVLWQLSETDAAEVERVWRATQAAVRAGVRLVPRYRRDGSLWRVENNLPGQRQSPVSHVRPHTGKAAYRFDGVEVGSLAHANQLPDGRWMTKQCFWFNRGFIQAQVQRLLEALGGA